jgi:hypothetical protein
MARQLHRIASIDVIKELHALDHAPAIDIETGDDALGKQGGLPDANCRMPIGGGSCPKPRLPTANRQSAIANRQSDAG